MNIQEALDLAQACGFSHWGEMNLEKRGFVHDSGNASRLPGTRMQRL